MHLFDLVCGQILTNDGDAAADSNVLPVGCFFGLLERSVRPFANEVEGRAAFHREGWSWVMGEHKDGHVIRRIVAPPALPGVARPRAPNWAEHVATEDPGADVFEGLKAEIVVDAQSSAGLTVHLFESLGVEKPPVQLRTASSEGIVEVLPGPGAKPVQ